MDFRNNKVLCEINMYSHSQSNYNMVERKARAKEWRREKIRVAVEVGAVKKKEKLVP